MQAHEKTSRADDGATTMTITSSSDVCHNHRGRRRTH